MLKLAGDAERGLGEKASVRPTGVEFKERVDPPLETMGRLAEEAASGDGVQVRPSASADNYDTALVVSYNPIKSPTLSRYKAAY